MKLTLLNVFKVAFVATAGLIAAQLVCGTIGQLTIMMLSNLLN